MNKIGHSLGAVTISALIINKIDQPIISTVLITGGIIIGSFLPDLDAKYSFIRNKFKLFAALYDLLPQNSFTQHRGALFHSVLTLIPLILLSKYSIILGVLLGVLGHHILDMLSGQGLRYFWPFKMRVRVK